MKTLSRVAACDRLVIFWDGPRQREASVPNIMAVIDSLQEDDWNEEQGKGVSVVVSCLVLRTSVITFFSSCFCQMMHVRLV